MTTHHMEEASHLGHSIAIMVDGRLACVGAPQHLKTKYGEGYQLMCKMKRGAGGVEGVLERIKGVVSDATMLEMNAGQGRIGIGAGLGKEYVG